MFVVERKHASEHTGTRTLHVYLLGGGGSLWCLCVSVGVGVGGSQLGEQDREIDDLMVFYFPWHFQKVASDYTTIPHSWPTSGIPRAFSSSHRLLP